MATGNTSGQNLNQMSDPNPGLSNVIILIENCNVFMKEEFLGIFG